MSELINMQSGQSNFRRYLLASVSAATLMVSACVSRAALADDGADRPTVWIELGGQLERMSDSQEAFSPPFMASIAQAKLLSALDVQNPSAFSIGGEGSISFQSDDSDWIFSASLRYGRSNAARHNHQQTKNAVVPVHFTIPNLSGYKVGPKYYYLSGHHRFADGNASQSENHVILDFQAGKDVGLGMFGIHGSSVLSAGIRIAQFNSKSTVSLNAVSDLQYPTAINSVAGFLAFKYDTVRFHGYAASATIHHGFHGVGPSLIWNASAPFAGSADRAEFTFDWGANAALLFGKQKTSGHHQTVTTTYNLHDWENQNVKARGYDFIGHFGLGTPVHNVNAANLDRERSVTVPNLGGFAGVSLKWTNAKISLGYRADFFFSAVDGGIDAAQKENRGFYGPFASVSVGIGG